MSPRGHNSEGSRRHIQHIHSAYVVTSHARSAVPLVREGIAGISTSDRDKLSRPVQATACPAARSMLSRVFTILIHGQEFTESWEEAVQKLHAWRTTSRRTLGGGV